MKYPLTCENCNFVNMVDLEHLRSVSAGKIHSEEGYSCEKCGSFNRVFVSSSSLDDAVKRLEKLDATRKDFRYHFAKTLKKALGLQGQKWRDQNS